jgi:hypothetical protein
MVAIRDRNARTDPELISDREFRRMAEQESVQTFYTASRIASVFELGLLKGQVRF